MARLIQNNPWLGEFLQIHGSLLDSVKEPWKWGSGPEFDAWVEKQVTKTTTTTVQAGVRGDSH